MHPTGMDRGHRALALERANKRKLRTLLSTETAEMNIL